MHNINGVTLRLIRMSHHDYLVYNVYLTWFDISVKKKSHKNVRETGDLYRVLNINDHS